MEETKKSKLFITSAIELKDELEEVIFGIWLLRWPTASDRKYRLCRRHKLCVGSSVGC